MTLAIADEGDLIATIKATDLIEALHIAAEQLDVRDDDEADDYGFTLEAAHALRDRLQATLKAVHGVTK